MSREKKALNNHGQPLNTLLKLEHALRRAGPALPEEAGPRRRLAGAAGQNIRPHASDRRRYGAERPPSLSPSSSFFFFLIYSSFPRVPFSHYRSSCFTFIYKCRMLSKNTFDKFHLEILQNSCA